MRSKKFIRVGSVALLTACCVIGFSSIAFAAALYSGTTQSDSLQECKAPEHCVQFQCPTGESNDPTAGCAGSGYYCCTKTAPPQTTPSCMGFCIAQDQCEQLHQEPGGQPGAGCSQPLVWCGVQKKATVAPSGQQCTCEPQSQCTTNNISTGANCPNKTDVCCLPAAATAQPTAPTSPYGACGGQYGFPCPLGEDVTAIPGQVIRWALGVVGAVFFVMMIWGGALYITAGDSKRAEEGKKTLINAVAGVMAVALSYTVLNWVLSMVGKSLGK